MPAPAYRYRAQLVRIVDADTVDLVIDLGLRVSVEARVRLAGLNAPEADTETGAAAVGFVQNWFAQHSDLVIETSKDRHDRDETEKYGRWLASIHSGVANLNDALLAAGLAMPWDGRGPRPTTL